MNRHNIVFRLVVTGKGGGKQEKNNTTVFWVEKSFSNEKGLSKVSCEIVPEGVDENGQPMPAGDVCYTQLISEIKDATSSNPDLFDGNENVQFKLFEVPFTISATGNHRDLNNSLRGRKYTEINIKIPKGRTLAKAIEKSAILLV